MPRERLEKIIDNFKVRFERRKLKEELNKMRPLAEIAAKLNERYFSGKLKINSIEYATDQNSRFGCCNRRDATIRVSHRLSRMPEWVRNYVIIHEMAHLVEPNHGPAFWNIVSRYELAERAKGYLIAVGLDSENEQDLENP
ncbi:MAG: M48 family metallopeptidase [Candidatus Omnitrophota bacterium]|nr:M48 family metallopeptidase [Candidatus Omnitrophota bacterium]